MIWTLSDGTVVHLGGNVEGDSKFADEIRRYVRAAREGLQPVVQAMPPPGGVALDLEDPWHIHCLVRDCAYRAGLRDGGWVDAERVHVVSAPEVEAPEWDEPHDPDAIY